MSNITVSMSEQRYCKYNIYWHQHKSAYGDSSSQAFHLPTAVALGHCSFEAYNAPPAIHGIKEVDPHGTETIYMDREFMEEVVTGVLAVHIDNAALGFQPEEEASACPFLTLCLGPSAGTPSRQTLCTQGTTCTACMLACIHVYVNFQDSPDIIFACVLG